MTPVTRSLEIVIPLGFTNNHQMELMEGAVSTVAQMSKEELQEIIEAIVEQKLVELLGDPEADLPIKEALRERLMRQRQLVEKGERGSPMEEVAKRLGLE